MAVRLQFEGIRCFSEPQEAAIRPITLLVGENSSGKSTFLALCQIAHAIAAGKSEMPFNKPPFLLGSYDQVASYRAGRAGRVRSFSLTICPVEPRPCFVRTDFASRHGQPSIDTWRLTVGDLVLQAKANENTAEYTVSLQGPRGAFELAGAPTPYDLFTHLQNALVLEMMKADGSGPHGDRTLTQHDLQLLTGALTSIRRELTPQPYAFAPIRTSPRRTYDPVGAAPEPEGSHIPMLLATMARATERDAWIALESALSEFGARSGLFEGIEIVNKGKKESDPFQIAIKSGGPAFNLIDVGYGVSQALPILVDTMRQASSAQLFLLQQPEVHLHPRAQAELGSFFAGQADKKRRFVIETHSDHLVDRVRMEIRRKKLKPEDVSLLYFERGKHGATIHNLELDRNGGIVNPPEGYRQFFLNEERELLGI
jgi:hypothetical protein